MSGNAAPRGRFEHGADPVRGRARGQVIDYLGLSEKYRPAKVTTLLVGEAPPRSGEKYFYLPAKVKVMANLRRNSSLPATIFHGYFGKLPRDVSEYEAMLLELKNRGIFLIDICDEPVTVRNNPAGVQRIKEEIPRLRRKMAARGLNVADEAITFLLARSGYAPLLKAHFPRSIHISWVDFRTRAKM
jgi:hypothetical protein